MGTKFQSFVLSLQIVLKPDMSETKLHNQGIIREVSGNGQQIEAQKIILVVSSSFCRRINIHIQWFTWKWASEGNFFWNLVSIIVITVLNFNRLKSTPLHPTAFANLCGAWGAPFCRWSKPLKGLSDPRSIFECVAVLVIVEQGKAAVVGWEEEGGTAWRLNRPFSVALWSSACWISFCLESC